MPIKKIPAKALRFEAELEVTPPAEVPAPAENGSPSPVPVTLRARSANVVNHWWFGPCVHDFAGMTPAGAKLPLDYCHNCDEVIGFSDKQEVGSELTMSGQLIPFTAQDRASEVIHKSKLGVPYQASIYFDPETLVIEEVPAGMSAQANGQDYPGPVSVFRQWQLKGAAVCPYGMDANTSVQFSANDKEVSVQYKGEMSAPKPEEKPVQANDGKRFLTAFGDAGGRYFAEGKSFEEAQTLHSKSLETELAALKKINAEQAAAIAANRGMQTPLEFNSAEEGVGKPESSTKFNGLSSHMAKFASGIKFRTAS